VRMPWSRAARTAFIMRCSGFAPAIRRSISPSDSVRSSIRAKAGSNSSAPIAPVSRSMSRRRASSSLRNSSAMRPGSIPFAVQNAPKLANRSVVRTPPKSRSSPVLPSATQRHPPGPLGELGDHRPEGLIPRVVGRAGEQALVGALEEDARLPQRERLVPAHLAHRAAAALLVAGDQLLARREALAPGDGGERVDAVRRVSGLRVGGGQVAEVGERV